MSKKKVLDYDPKTGFGNFAEIMNKNYALDIARNGVNMPANNMVGAPLESGTLGGTQAQSGMLKVDTAIPPLADAAGATEDPVATDTETSTVTGTNASTGANTGAVSGVTSDLTGSTAQPILSVPGYKSDMGTYDEWMAKNGYDPDRDYDEKKAALEYDYETRMATYGRRAEELSQMGLSNSGLSDIYQLGAFNSYLQQQNQIANERIAEKKKYKQEYNTLYQKNQDALKLDNANAYNLGLSLYDGENIDFVRQQLTQQGYDASVVEQAVQSLAALDVNTLPVVKKQLAANEADINEAAAKLAESYTAENEAGIRQLYTEWANVMMPNGKTKLDLLIEKLNGYNTVAKPSEEEMAVAGMNLVQQTMGDEWHYDGTAMAKNDIERAVAGTEFDKYVEQITTQFEANRKSDADALVTDVLNKENVTIDELGAALDEAKSAYANNQAMLTDAEEKISEKTKGIFDWALEGKNGEPKRLGSAEVASALGYDADEWAALDDASREMAVIKRAGQLKKDGLLKYTDYDKLLTDILDPEIKNIIKVDKSNLQHSGLFDAGNLVEKIQILEENEYLTPEEYDEQIVKIIDGMGIYMRSSATGNSGFQIKWNVSGVSALFDRIGSSQIREEDNPQLYEVLSSHYNDDSTTKVKSKEGAEWFVYNDIIYQNIGGAFYQISRDDVSFGFIADEHKDGIYDIAVLLIENNKVK